MHVARLTALRVVEAFFCSLGLGLIRDRLAIGQDHSVAALLCLQPLGGWLAGRPSQSARIGRCRSAVNSRSHAWRQPSLS